MNWISIVLTVSVFANVGMSVLLLKLLADSAKKDSLINRLNEKVVQYHSLVRELRSIGEIEEQEVFSDDSLS